MGVWDPYGLLGPGEVFVQFSQDTSSSSADQGFKYLQGGVLVTRSPTVHPGDIRRLKAVDIPELQHIVNVIVFSTRGSRPEQDKMSSGDLDGDEYWIWWRKEIVEQFKESDPDGSEDINDIFESLIIQQRFHDILFGQIDNDNLNLETEILREDWIVNFIEFMKNDKLGIVADLHAQIADSGKDMIKSDGKCHP